jgi:hypothetical protein
MDEIPEDVHHLQTWINYADVKMREEVVRNSNDVQMNRHGWTDQWWKQKIKARVISTCTAAESGSLDCAEYIYINVQRPVICFSDSPPCYSLQLLPPPLRWLKRDSLTSSEYEPPAPPAPLVQEAPAQTCRRSQAACHRPSCWLVESSSVRRSSDAVAQSGPVHER